MSSSSRVQIRWRFTRFWLVAVAATAAAGAATVAVWPHAWKWAVIATGLIAAGSPVVQSALSAALLRRSEAAKLIRGGLLGTRGFAGEILPVAAEADLATRVHRAVLEIPYICRDAEAEVRLHLSAGTPVLLVGSSMVGKTRMASRLIQEMFPDRGVVIPDTREALASLDAADVRIRRSVIFLDDINRLVGTGGITDGALRRLAAAGNTIIGTIRASEYDRLQPTAEARPPEWDVLSIFERIFITRDLSVAENQRIAQAVADPDARARIRKIGLGEYVGAAGHIAEALRLGPSVCPAGYALVLGVADWQRAGMSMPVPARLLRRLGTPHLARRNRKDLFNKQIYQLALTWATRDINPTAALLQQTDPGAFVVYDYALDLLSNESRPIPQTIWKILLENAVPRDLISIGYSALHRRAFEVASEAWRRAADSGDRKAFPLAAFNLGVLLSAKDVDGARKSYQRAIDSKHHHYAPKAAVNLGILLAEQGDMENAQAAFQIAVDSRHRDQSPAAEYNLGVLFTRQGDIDGAGRAFQRAIDTGHVSEAPAAAVALGNLLANEGDLGAARAAYQAAITSGHEVYGPIAEESLESLSAPREGSGNQKYWEKAGEDSPIREEHQADLQPDFRKANVSNARPAEMLSNTSRRSVIKSFRQS